MELVNRKHWPSSDHRSKGEALVGGKRMGMEWSFSWK